MNKALEPSSPDLRPIGGAGHNKMHIYTQTCIRRISMYRLRRIASDNNKGFRGGGKKFWHIRG